MTEDSQNHENGENGENAEGTAAEVTEASPSGAGESGEGSGDGPLERSVLRTGNGGVLGVLRLSYAARDVEIVLDGDSALRLLAIYRDRARPRSDQWADAMDPLRSDANNAWVVLDVNDVLAMSWAPGLAQRPPRTTIDPAVVS